MEYLVIANFKSHKTASDVESWLQEVSASSSLENIKLLLAPSFPHLFKFTPSPNITLAAQNVSRFPQGAYTGEVNASQLKDMGVTHCIVGHSERRRYFKETSQDVLAKITELQEVGITPVLCVDTDNYLEQLSLLNLSQKQNLIIAYEPLEAIGTGNPADPDSVADVFATIRKASETDIPLLYGGSVTTKDVKLFLELENLSGFLVGGASLDTGSFLPLLETISKNE